MEEQNFRGTVFLPGETIGYDVDCRICDPEPDNDQPPDAAPDHPPQDWSHFAGHHPSEPKHGSRKCRRAFWNRVAKRRAKKGYR